jgi:cysteine desulfurase/selenocysteine lyase
MEHHANLLPWQWIAQEKQATLKFIPVTPEGTLDLTQLATIITERTKFVGIVATSNALGTRNDVGVVVARARAVGAKILVDACQSVPHEVTNVQALDCDFLVFSGHKMLGPTGSGVLYIRQELHNVLQPYQRGGGMVREAYYEHAQWLGMPQLLEAGTPLLAQVIGLGAAIEYYNHHVNFAALQEHEALLTRMVIDGLSALPDVRILGPVHELKHYGHSVTFVHERYHPHDVAAFLDTFGICVRAGHFCAQPLFRSLGLLGGAVRVSFLGYNTVSEVERFLDVIKKL